MTVLMFLTHAFVVIYVSISHTRFKSLVCALNGQYLAIFFGSVDAYFRSTDIWLVVSYESLWGISKRNYVHCRDHE